MIDSIYNLPVEIISRIISLIDSKESLCEISLCSKFFQRITLPYLYRHMELYDRADHQSSPVTTFWRLRDLTILFLRKPEYASLVRHLTIRNSSKDGWDEDGWSIDNDWSDSDNDSECKPIKRVEDRQLVRRAIRSLSNTKEKRKDWFNAVNRCNDHQDALLAIMLPVLIRLEKLDLMMMIDSLEYLERTLKRIVNKKRPFDTHPALTALTDIVHMGYHDRCGMRATYFSNFLRLPAIRAVYGHRVATGGKKPVIERGLAYFRLTNSDLTHLEFRECRLHSVDLCAILQVTTNLRTFIYEYEAYNSYSSLNTPDLQTALGTLQETLEDVWLDYVGSFNKTTDIVKAMDFAPFTSL